MNYFKSTIETDPGNEWSHYSESSRKRIIAVSSQKGGVGKSTTAINLSAYLGELGFRTILLDMDPQGNSTCGLGINCGNLDPSVYDMLTSNKNMDKVCRKTNFKNLSVIPSNWNLVKAEAELIALNGCEFRLKESIDRIRSDYDFIIIDCSPSLGTLTTNALTAANEVLIPVQCEFFAMEGMPKLIETIDNINSRFNSSLEVSGIVLTMYSKTLFSSRVTDHIKKHFRGHIFDTIIPKNIRLAEASGAGKPVSVFDSGCRGAHAYKKLAQEIIEYRNNKNSRETFMSPRNLMDFWNTGQSPRHAISKAGVTH